jgi:hypothetical protein
MPRICRTCKYFIPGDSPAEGACTHTALAQDKPSIAVKANDIACAGQFWGHKDYWEPRPGAKPWWAIWRTG